MRQRRHAGFSLIELMLGLAVSLLLVAIMASIYLSSKQSSRVIDTTGRLQEGARYAMETIRHDLSMAGFRGCYSATNSPVSMLNTPTAYAYQFDQPIFGYHASGGSWSPALDASISALLPASGNDILSIRLVHDNGSALTTGMTTSKDPLMLTSGNFSQGDLILLADCTTQTVFQATQVNSAPSPVTIKHDISTQPAPGNVNDDFGHVFNTDATAYRVLTRTYYIAPGKVGLNSLWAYSDPDYNSGSAQAQELVEGVEQLALLFGVDTDNDQAANRYVTADKVTDWNKVVSVRLQLLMVSVQDNVAPVKQSYSFPLGTTSQTAPDNRIRSVFTSVITLRNRVL